MASVVARLLAALVVAAWTVHYRPVVETAESACGTPVQADRAAPVQLPIRVANNHVYFKMCVAGTARWFWLDSGAERSILDMAVADALGLSKGRETRSNGMGPGSTAGAEIKGAEIFLAERPSLRVAPSTALPVGSGGFQDEPITGIVGGDFIRQAVLEIDYVQQRMRVYDPGAFHYAGKARPIRLTLVNGRPHIRGELVLADGGIISADCHIDIGATRSLALTKPFVESNQLLSRVGPTIFRPAGAGMGGVAWGYLGRVASLRLGDVQLASVITALFGDSAGVFSSGTQFQANIGGEILRRFVVTLDYTHGQLMLEPNGVTDSFETDMSGAWYQIDEATGGLRVRDPLPQSAADRAGLVDGDLIVSIDGRLPREMDVDARRQTMERDGATVVLRVRRDGADRDVKLILRRLI